MANAPIRIGVVGVSYGAVVHIPAFQSEGLDVVAVCARRQERADQAAARYGIPNAFSDHRAMLHMDGLDAVSIVTPVSTHYGLTMDALEAGKHVICEKPLAHNQAQARELLEKAQSKGLTAMIGHEFRFASGRMRVKELVDEGYLGPLHMALLSLVAGPADGFKVRAPGNEVEDPQGNGFLSRLGSHYIDCLCHWFGDVESVWGREVTHFDDRPQTEAGQAVPPAHDSFHLVLRFVNGGWATMTGSSAAPFGSGGRIELYGRDGTLLTPHSGRGFNPPPHGVLLGAKAGDTGLAELTIPKRLEPFSDDRDDRMMPFRLLVREFIRGIKEGISPSPNFEDGLRVQRILDAIRESTATGETVTL